MSTVAILGAGPLGAAIAHRLAQGGRVNTVTLIDASETVAMGKALDIRQAAPIERSDTTVDAGSDSLSATGATVVVVADEVDGGEWEGERGLAMLRRLGRAGLTAPIVFAGARQLWLMERAFGELRFDRNRLVGTAPSAMVAALGSWVGLEMNLSTADVTAVGRPPGLVVAWSTAVSGGALVTDRVPAHRLQAIARSLTRLWPPGPLAVASATAPIVDGLVAGSRRLHPALTILDGEMGARGRAVMLPLELAPGRVRTHVIPSLSPQERTDLLNSIEGS